jgi:peptidylprolyl isomerase
MRTRTLIAAGLAALSLVVAGCSEDKVKTNGDESSKAEKAPAADASLEPTATTGDPAPTTKPKVVVPNGPPPKKLVIKDVKKGTGPAVKAGDNIAANYVGVAYSTGKEFDNSYDRGEPIQFPLGTGGVIPGWDQGIVGMKVGGRRTLIIPSALAYGQQGSPPDIKPGETLIFTIDLVGKQ